MSKFGRNKPCWCGSGKKYKKCHYPYEPTQVERDVGRDEAFTAALRQAEVREHLRKMQQGRGRPVIEGKLGDYQFVATGNTIHYSKKWKTFPDFLFDYIIRVFGKEWGEAEGAKPEGELHPVLYWHRKIVELQAKSSKGDGQLYSAEMTGAVYCYLGLAYNLYLINHNVELQDRLVARLRKSSQFQGAYYELIVANCLIRAGFKLELEDEADESQKHCEFSAVSPDTGKTYWVEAKMRSVAGVLGKTSADASKGSDPTSQISKHVREALKKPADGERLIFIDVNAEPLTSAEEPAWSARAYERLADRERDLKDGQQAYVFVTTFPYHRALDEWQVGKAVLAFGLGMSDFAKVGPTTLSNWYRGKQVHSDAYALLESMRSYPQLPETLDGRPLSEVADGEKSARLLIGQEYFFEGVGGNGMLGTLKQVLVDESKSTAKAVVSTRSGKSVILDTPLSKSELEAYKRYGLAFFGELEERSGKSNDEFELFEFFVKNYIKTPRDRLLELAKDHPNFEAMKELDHEDLVLAICEGWVLATLQRTGRPTKGKLPPESDG